MPELPEVETVKRGLERTIVGKVFAQVDVRTKKSFSDDAFLIERILIGARVSAVTRRAKVLLVELSSGWTLAIHLKMTGQLVVKQREISNDKIQIPNKFQNSKSKLATVEFIGGHPEKAYEQPLPHKHTQVIFTFTDGTTLYFNDLRKFGWLKLLRGSNGIKNKELSPMTPTSIGLCRRIKGSKVETIIPDSYFIIPTVDAFIDSLQLGPEPLGPDFTIEYFIGILKKRSIPIKQLLLEQKGISGIGNIYADEALFRAAIYPTRKANSLQRLEIRKLHKAIREVLELGIEHGGTSKNTYLNVMGTKGKMQDYLTVYQRTSKPCIVCATPIERIKIGQRSSHFCPSCQK